MEADKLKDEIFIQNCPIRNILSRISDKWSILVIFTLEQAPVMRFGELQRTIPDILQKMLTVTLRTLEQDGIVKRQVYAQIPPKVEYSLTARGVSLLPHLNSLIYWAKDQMDSIMQDRKRNELQS
ncbi:MAG: helix-turn-helix transcriptional regulator [Bacteroides sp.]|nr:helix-turn-helix transcriptional regulator [Bacteroides sp.]